MSLLSHSHRMILKRYSLFGVYLIFCVYELKNVKKAPNAATGWDSYESHPRLDIKPKYLTLRNFICKTGSMMVKY